jgi:hypothetical protein
MIPPPEPVAPLDQADPLARRLLPVIRAMVREEAEKLSPPAPRVTMLKLERDIMEAAQRVARACDHLVDVKYTRDEPSARVQLEKAAATLKRVMKKHGRA